MNWVGGARSRIKLTSDQKKQREHFRKKRHEAAQGRVSQTSSSKTTLSRDILTFSILQMVSVKKNRMPKPIKVIKTSDLEKKDRFKTRYVRIPETPLESNIKLPESQNRPKYVPDSTICKSDIKEGHMNCLRNGLSEDHCRKKTNTKIKFSVDNTDISNIKTDSFFSCGNKKMYLDTRHKGLDGNKSFEKIITSTDFKSNSEFEISTPQSPLHDFPYLNSSDVINKNDNYNFLKKSQFNPVMENSKAEFIFNPCSVINDKLSKRFSDIHVSTYDKFKTQANSLDNFDQNIYESRSENNVHQCNGMYIPKKPFLHSDDFVNSPGNSISSSSSQSPSFILQQSHISEGFTINHCNKSVNIIKNVNTHQSIFKSTKRKKHGISNSSKRKYSSSDNTCDFIEHVGKNDPLANFQSAMFHNPDSELDDYASFQKHIPLLKKSKFLSKSENKQIFSDHSHICKTDGVLLENNTVFDSERTQHVEEENISQEKYDTCNLFNLPEFKEIGKLSRCEEETYGLRGHSQFPKPNKISHKDYVAKGCSINLLPNKLHARNKENDSVNYNRKLNRNSLGYNDSNIHKMSNEFKTPQSLDDYHILNHTNLDTLCPNVTVPSFVRSKKYKNIRRTDILDAVHKEHNFERTGIYNNTHQSNYLLCNNKLSHRANNRNAINDHSDQNNQEFSHSTSKNSGNKDLSKKYLSPTVPEINNSIGLLNIYSKPNFDQSSITKKKETLSMQNFKASKLRKSYESFHDSQIHDKPPYFKAMHVINEERKLDMYTSQSDTNFNSEGSQNGKEVCPIFKNGFKSNKNVSALNDQILDSNKSPQSEFKNENNFQNEVCDYENIYKDISGLNISASFIRNQSNSTSKSDKYDHTVSRNIFTSNNFKECLDVIPSSITETNLRKNCIAEIYDISKAYNKEDGKDRNVCVNLLSSKNNSMLRSNAERQYFKTKNKEMNEHENSSSVCEPDLQKNANQIYQSMHANIYTCTKDLNNSLNAEGIELFGKRMQKDCLHTEKHTNINYKRLKIADDLKITSASSSKDKTISRTINFNKDKVDSPNKYTEFNENITELENTSSLGFNSQFPTFTCIDTDTCSVLKKQDTISDFGFIKGQVASNSELEFACNYKKEEISCLEYKQTNKTSKQFENSSNYFLRNVSLKFGSDASDRDIDSNYMAKEVTIDSSVELRGLVSQSDNSYQERNKNDIRNEYSHVNIENVLETTDAMESAIALQHNWKKSQHANYKNNINTDYNPDEIVFNNQPSTVIETSSFPILVTPLNSLNVASPEIESNIDIKLLRNSENDSVSKEAKMELIHLVAPENNKQSSFILSKNNNVAIDSEHKNVLEEEPLLCNKRSREISNFSSSDEEISDLPPTVPNTPRNSQTLNLESSNFISKSEIMIVDTLDSDSLPPTLLNSPSAGVSLDINDSLNLISLKNGLQKYAEKTSGSLSSEYLVSEPLSISSTLRTENMISNFKDIKNIASLGNTLNSESNFRNTQTVRQKRTKLIYPNTFALKSHALPKKTFRELSSKEKSDPLNPKAIIERSLVENNPKDEEHSSNSRATYTDISNNENKNTIFSERQNSDTCRNSDFRNSQILKHNSIYNNDINREKIYKMYPILSNSKQHVQNKSEANVVSPEIEVLQGSNFNLNTHFDTNHNEDSLRVYSSNIVRNKVEKKNKIAFFSFGNGFLSKSREAIPEESLPSSSNCEVSSIIRNRNTDLCLKSQVMVQIEQECEHYKTMYSSNVERKNEQFSENIADIESVESNYLLLETENIHPKNYQISSNQNDNKLICVNKIQDISISNNSTSLQKFITTLQNCGLKDCNNVKSVVKDTCSSLMNVKENKCSGIYVECGIQTDIPKCEFSCQVNI